MNDLTKPYRVKNNIKKFNIANEINEDNSNVGFINVTVIDAVTKEPIKNATIEIIKIRIFGVYHERGFGDIIYTMTTDLNGEVRNIELPSNYEQNEILDSDYEHIHYHMGISAEGYYYVFVANILIYPEITNIYRINLSPSTMEHPQYEFIITPVIP